MQRLLITGGSGYLGARLVDLARPRASVRSTTHRQPTAGTTFPLDLARDDPRPVLERARPEVILHAAAINPGASSDAVMRAVNEEGTRRLAEAAAETGCRRFVHVSTDVVHDGTRGPYDETAAPTATSAYGLSKAAGESAVLSTAPSPLVVRTSLIYGLETPDRGVAGFARTLVGGGTVQLFSDVQRQPIWVETLASALLFLALDCRCEGILNVAGGQVLSREQLARRQLRFWGVPFEPEQVRSVEAAAVAPGIPRDLRLNLTQAHQILPMPLPGVDAVLARAQRPAPRPWR